MDNFFIIILTSTLIVSCILLIYIFILFTKQRKQIENIGNELTKQKNEYEKLDNKFQKLAQSNCQFASELQDMSKEKKVLQRLYKLKEALLKVFPWPKSILEEDRELLIEHIFEAYTQHSLQYIYKSILDTQSAKIEDFIHYLTFETPEDANLNDKQCIEFISRLIVVGISSMNVIYNYQKITKKLQDDLKNKEDETIDGINIEDIINSIITHNTWTKEEEANLNPNKTYRWARGLLIAIRNSNLLVLEQQIRLNGYIFNASHITH